MEGYQQLLYSDGAWLSVIQDEYDWLLKTTQSFGTLENSWEI